MAIKLKKEFNVLITKLCKSTQRTPIFYINEALKLHLPELERRYVAIEQAQKTKNQPAIPPIATNKFAKLIAKYEKAYTDSWFCDVLKLDTYEFEEMKSGLLGVSDAKLQEFSKTLQDETVEI